MGGAGNIEHGLGAQRAEPFLQVFRKSVGQGDHHRGEIGFPSAAGEIRAGVRGKAELGGEPAERVPLNFVCRRRGAPGGQLRIEHGDHRVRDDGSGRNAGIVQTEVARVRNLYLPLAEHLLNVRDNFIQNQRLGEAVAGSEIVADFLWGYGGDQGAAGDFRFQLPGGLPNLIRAKLRDIVHLKYYRMILPRCLLCRSRAQASAAPVLVPAQLLKPIPIDADGGRTPCVRHLGSQDHLGQAGQQAV